MKERDLQDFHMGNPEILNLQREGVDKDQMEKLTQLYYRNLYVKGTTIFLPQFSVLSVFFVLLYS